MIDLKQTKRVFVSSAFASNPKENVKLAIKYGKYTMDQGMALYIPHLMYPRWIREDDPIQRRMGIDAGLKYLEICDQMWAFFPSNEEEWTSGMTTEREAAFDFGIPVYVFLNGKDAIFHGIIYRSREQFEQRR